VFIVMVEALVPPGGDKKLGKIEDERKMERCRNDYLGGG
jgi:hypothetical protein